MDIITASVWLVVIDLQLRDFEPTVALDTVMSGVY